MSIRSAKRIYAKPTLKEYGDAALLTKNWDQDASAYDAYNAGPTLTKTGFDTDMGGDQNPRT
jgi:hypothetical protein